MLSKPWYLALPCPFMTVAHSVPLSLLPSSYPSVPPLPPPLPSRWRQPPPVLLFTHLKYEVEGEIVQF